MNTVWVIYFLIVSVGDIDSVNIQKIQVVKTQQECQHIVNVLRGKVAILRPRLNSNGSAIPQTDFYCHQTDKRFYNRHN